MAGRQPFHPVLQFYGDRVGLARVYRIGPGQAGRIGAWHVGQLVVGPWHDAVSHTFGNRTIVTGNVHRPGERRRQETLQMLWPRE